MTVRIAPLLASMNVKNDYKTNFKEDVKLDWKVDWASDAVAAFTALPLTGTATVTPIVFTNASTGSITTYLWNFGDGTTSTLAAPTHTYATAGSKTVTLTVSGKGGTNTGTRAAYIVIS